MRWLILLLFLSSCTYVEFENAKYKVAIADTPDEQVRGLMYVKEMPDDEGMFFVFPESKELSFWMKNTLIPLDIIFIDEELRVLNVAHAVPCKQDPCVSYFSKGDAMYVLELNKGISERYNITKGSQVINWG